MPAVPTPHPNPLTFVWFPLNGRRHAIDREECSVPLGVPMRCLCGATHPRGPDGEMERTLWLTCEQCWDETCTIVGLHPNGRHGHQE
ncbi:MAG: zinc finger protein [Pseudonocardiaceae bacterium]